LVNLKLIKCFGGFLLWSDKPPILHIKAYYDIFLQQVAIVFLLAMNTWECKILSYFPFVVVYFVCSHCSLSNQITFLMFITIIISCLLFVISIVGTCFINQDFCKPQTRHPYHTSNTYFSKFPSLDTLCDIVSRNVWGRLCLSMWFLFPFKFCHKSTQNHLKLLEILSWKHIVLNGQVVFDVF
jgi:hypothetical protein